MAKHHQRRGNSPPAADNRLAGVWPVAVLMLVVTAAYSNSFHGEFVFDDLAAIRDNETIRELWPPTKMLSPPGLGTTVDGRPLLNVSLAFDYAIGGTDVVQYHRTNLAIHLAASLVLFGLIRRTLRLPVFSAVWRDRATGLALSAALLWAIHPLQTESVTYLVQRAESLAGLLLLSTLYCFLRGAESGKPATVETRATSWFAASIACCTLGMAAKETMVAAPLLTLLYDRTFLAGSWKDAWKTRGGVYACLFAGWLLLAWLVWQSGGRGGTAGFGEQTNSWRYALTQFTAIVHYLRLSVWPRPLVMDYGDALVEPGWWLLPYGLVVAGLIAVTLVALWRWPKLGFVGAWFWCLLAPTSSVVPVHTQTMAEHRMYLPLAAVMIVVVLAVWALWQEMGARAVINCTTPLKGYAPLLLLTAAVTALGVQTWLRNEDYRTRLSIWNDTAKKAPLNSRALASVGDEFFDIGQPLYALEYVSKAIDLKPLDAKLRCGRADMHKQLSDEHRTSGRREEARTELQLSLADYSAALRLDPANADLWYKRALAHHRLGNWQASEWQSAVADYSQSLALRPNWPEALNNRADAQLKGGNFDAAWADVHRLRALGIEPMPALLQNLVRESGQPDPQNP